jgi:hypothetical protein
MHCAQGYAYAANGPHPATIAQKPRGYREIPPTEIPPNPTP